MLVASIGCPDKALGALVRAWSIAQKFYRIGDGRIPIDDWNEQRIPEQVIESGLAESNGTSVRMRGADKQFSWLLSRAENGRLGGIAKKENRNSCAQRQLASAKRMLASAKPPTPTLSLSLKEEEEGVISSAVALPSVIRIWNEHCGTLPKASRANKPRAKLASVRWAERPDENTWIEIVKKVSQSRFCNGHNDRGWRATIDFLLRTGTADKVLEGVYDNRDSAKTDYKFLEES